MKPRLCVLIFLLLCSTVQAQVKYWVEPNSHFKDFTVKQTQDAIATAINEFEDVSGIKFERVSKRGPARIRISFVPGTHPGFDNAGGRCNDVGGGREIWVNETRDFALDRLPNRRFPIILIQHEIGHCLLGWRHTTDRNDVMHISSGADFFSPREVLRLQNMYGNPKAPFYPLAIYGNQIRAYNKLINEFDAAMTRWRKYRDLRDAETDMKKREALDLEVRIELAIVRQLVDQLNQDRAAVVQAVKKWNETASRWRPYHVPMARGF